MKFIRWNDLTEEEINIRLKKIFSTLAAIFIVILILILMKCEGCSSESRKHKRNFKDGHVYGEELSGSELFDDEYGKGAEDFTGAD